MATKLCPCGSEQPFENCCEPLLTGEKIPTTAEQLMRSRYTAYAECDIDYLYKTSGAAVRKDFDAESSRTWAKSTTWHGIDVLNVKEGSEVDNHGEIEFVAHYSIKDSDFEHHENATFEKIDGEWLFTDGRIVTAEPIQRESPKVGRNEPCPCGSTKKYKKCCGK